MKKKKKSALSCGLKLGAYCLCVNISVFFSVPLDVSFTQNTLHHPPQSLYVFVLLCLVSVREERVKGQGLWSPQGTARGSQSKAGKLSRGAPVVVSAPLIADVFFSYPLRYVRRHACSMCSCTHKQTLKKRRKCVLCCSGLRCVSLFMLRASGSGNVTQSVYCCTFLGRDYKRAHTATQTQSQKHVGPPCLCVYVHWLSHNL